MVCVQSDSAMRELVIPQGREIEVERRGTSVELDRYIYTLAKKNFSGYLMIEQKKSLGLVTLKKGKQVLNFFRKGELPLFFGPEIERILELLKKKETSVKVVELTEQDVNSLLVQLIAILRDSLPDDSLMASLHNELVLQHPRVRQPPNELLPLIKLIRVVL